LSDSAIRLTTRRKKLVRRAAPDHSQHYRGAFQFAFLCSTSGWEQRFISGFASSKPELTSESRSARRESKDGFPSPD